MAALIIPLHHDEPTEGASTRRTGTGEVPAIADSWSARHRGLVAAMLALLVAVGTMRSAPDVAAWLAGDTPPAPDRDTTHLVRPGDTLWSIARTIEPHGDVRPLVDRLVELNGGAELRVGDTLVLRW